MKGTKDCHVAEVIVMTHTRWTLSVLPIVAVFSASLFQLFFKCNFAIWTLLHSKWQQSVTDVAVFHLMLWQQSVTDVAVFHLMLWWLMASAYSLCFSFSWLPEVPWKFSSRKTVGKYRNDIFTGKELLMLFIYQCSSMEGTFGTADFTETE